MLQTSVCPTQRHLFLLEYMPPTVVTIRQLNVMLFTASTQASHVVFLKRRFTILEVTPSLSDSFSTAILVSMTAVALLLCQDTYRRSKVIGQLSFAFFSPQPTISKMVRGSNSKLFMLMIYTKVVINIPEQTSMTAPMIKTDMQPPDD